MGHLFTLPEGLTIFFHIYLTDNYKKILISHSPKATDSETIVTAFHIFLLIFIALKKKKKQRHVGSKQRSVVETESRRVQEDKNGKYR